MTDGRTFQGSTSVGMVNPRGAATLTASLYGESIQSQELLRGGRSDDGGDGDDGDAQPCAHCRPPGP